jgi:hypothetical protein
MSHVRRFDHVGLTVADLDVVTACLQRRQVVTTVARYVFHLAGRLITGGLPGGPGYKPYPRPPYQLSHRKPDEIRTSHRTGRTT